MQGIPTAHDALKLKKNAQPLHAHTNIWGTCEGICCNKKITWRFDVVAHTELMIKWLMFQKIPKFLPKVIAMHGFVIQTTLKENYSTFSSVGEHPSNITISILIPTIPIPLQRSTPWFNTLKSMAFNLQRWEEGLDRSYNKAIFLWSYNSLRTSNLHQNLCGHYGFISTHMPIL